jgi:hypothetical protein
LTYYDDSPEVPWIAHLLWLQGGMPEGGPREFEDEARGIAIGLFKSPLLAKPLIWSCDCGAGGELVGPINSAGQLLLHIEEDHTGPEHRVALHNDSFS